MTRKSGNDTAVADRPDRRVPPARRHNRISRVASIAKSSWFIGPVTSLAAAYSRLLGATSRIIYEPRTPETIFAELAPFIATSWHGQAFLLPLTRPPDRAVDVLVTRHSDGELIARVLAKLGMGTIRASRASDRSRTREKGGIVGFMKMKSALAKGRTVVVTADSMRSASGIVGPGLIALARASGRPILPVGLAARRRIAVGSWDKAAVSLPFNQIACVTGVPIRVPADADDALLEAKRREVEAALNAAGARAVDIVGRRRGQVAKAR